MKKCKMYNNVKKNPTIKEIEDKAERALRLLSDVDVELNELIQMCKNMNHTKNSHNGG